MSTTSSRMETSSIDTALESESDDSKNKTLINLEDVLSGDAQSEISDHTYDEDKKDKKKIPVVS